MNPPFSAEAGLSAELGTPFPGGGLKGRFRLRNPFRVEKLPWLCRQHLLLHHGPVASGPKASSLRALRHKIYRLSRSLIFLPPGTASLRVGSQWRDFSFNPANTQFESIYAPAFRHGYEPECAVLIDALLPSDGVMFDIGANWGHVSLFAASHPGFRGRIHAFEPIVATYADLVASVGGAGLENLVTPHNVALSEREGTATMLIPDGDQSGLARFYNKGDPVRLASLDQLGLPAPSLMKIDVEGHEAGVLRGALQTIRQSRPMIFFESAMTGNVPAVLAPFHVLEREDYQFFLPVFVHVEGGAECYTLRLRGDDVGRPVCLGLMSFKPSGRSLLPDFINVFACHSGRWGEVVGIFNRSTGEEDVAPGNI